jgi:hypothetical protein
MSKLTKVPKGEVVTIKQQAYRSSQSDTAKGEVATDASICNRNKKH